jgi:hypothetical protein
MEPHVDIDVAYTKTALGRSFLEHPPVAGNRGRRSLLIMVDGHRTLRSMLPVIRSLGLSLEDVQSMVMQGLLEPARPRAARAQDAPARAPAPAAAPQPARSAAPRQALPAPTAVPAVASAAASQGRPAAAAGPAPAGRLAAVKEAVAELLSEALGRSESRLHGRLAAVENAPALAEWLDECLMYLAAVHGSTHAMRFRMEVAARLPLSAQRPGTLADLVPGRVSPRRQSRDAPATGPGALLEDG